MTFALYWTNTSAGVYLYKHCSWTCWCEQEWQHPLENVDMLRRGSRGPWWCCFPCIYKKGPQLPRLSYFISRCSFFEMSSSRQMCNGGQPALRRSVCEVCHVTECVALCCVTSDLVICVPAVIESSPDLYVSDWQSCSTGQRGFYRKTHKAKCHTCCMSCPLLHTQSSICRYSHACFHHWFAHVHNHTHVHKS